MLTPNQISFATQMVAQAQASGHPWPGYAAAEAVLESGWGSSGLTQVTKDVFGLKEPSWWTGQVYEEQTREVINGVSEMVDATWPVFTTFADAFAARLKTLQALPSVYGEALAATSGPEFIRLVSGYWIAAAGPSGNAADNIFQFPSGWWKFVNPPPCRWSTAPNRASQVLATHASHPDIFGV